MVSLFVLVFVGCVPPQAQTEVNPFRDLPPIALDGTPQDLSTNVAPLGSLEAGQVLRLKVTGEPIESVLVLAEDPASVDSVLLAGGGPAGEFFDYRVQVPGRYFAYVQFSPAANEPAARLSPLLPAGTGQHATITAMPGDPAFQPPARQAVRVVFQPGYLTDPGLVDPESFTAEERQVLVDVSELVRGQIMDELRAVFAITPIDIVDERDAMPPAPFSTLTFSPQRMPADPQVTFDTVVPGVDPQSPCLEPVIFGELLPRGLEVDPGNHTLDDQAVVYVGSFQGRGLACRSAVIASLNNVVLALAHTGAHEIGHLVGLYHVAIVDLMDRQPTIAFQRGLGFARGQMLTEFPALTADGRTEVQTRVLTSIVQDPAFYFLANFAK